MSRPRREDESYEKYRENLKAEAKALKEYLRGVVVKPAPFSRRLARAEMNRRGPEFREKIMSARGGVQRRVESHRKMGG